MAEKDQGIKIVARNRKAHFEYLILKKFEAGLVLTGTEVKSLRNGQVALSDAFAVVRSNEVFLQNLDIPEYSHGNRMNHDPKRRRKLLLNKVEILKIVVALQEKGLTLIPLSIYFKKGWAKVEMALAKGKRTHDKRESMRKRDDRREMERALGKRGRQ